MNKRKKFVHLLKLYSKQSHGHLTCWTRASRHLAIIQPIASSLVQRNCIEQSRTYSVCCRCKHTVLPRDRPALLASCIRCVLSTPQRTAHSTIIVCNDQVEVDCGRAHELRATYVKWWTRIYTGVYIAINKTMIHWHPLDWIDLIRHLYGGKPDICLGLVIHTYSLTTEVSVYRNETVYISGVLMYAIPGCIGRQVCMCLPIINVCLRVLM